MASGGPHRAISESSAVTARLRTQREGQILVLAAIVFTFLFIPLGVFVVDTGQCEASDAQLNEADQAAAEDGASTLDEGLYRASNGRTVELDPAQARRVAGRALSVSSLPGLDSWQVDVRGRTVTVTARMTVRL